MKHKWFKKIMICALAAAATCMLVTVDRETSLINNRQPMIELSVVRVSDEYFNVSFLGNARDIKAEPIEKMWNQISGKINQISDKVKLRQNKADEWQETVLCQIVAE